MNTCVLICECLCQYHDIIVCQIFVCPFVHFVCLYRFFCWISLIKKKNGLSFSFFFLLFFCLCFFCFFEQIDRCLVNTFSFFFHKMLYFLLSFYFFVICFTVFVFGFAWHCVGTNVNFRVFLQIFCLSLCIFSLVVVVSNQFNGKVWAPSVYLLVLLCFVVSFCFVVAIFLFSFGFILFDQDIGTCQLKFISMLLCFYVTLKCYML